MTADKGSSAGSPAPTSSTRELLRAEGVSKGFPGVWGHLILDAIDFDVKAGEVHTLLGENGAGKTVLANILSGFYSSTSGQVYINEQPVELNSPKDGLKHGVGMIHQEVMLAGPYTVAENVLLGLDGSTFEFPLKKIERDIADLSERYGLQVHPQARVEDLAAGEQQRAEILKVLYHRPNVILLDEPTALLTPDEARQLVRVLREMAEEGFGIVYITHKMEEIMTVSDRITVLKLGQISGTRTIDEADEDELTQMMMGETIPIELERAPTEAQRPALDVDNLHVTIPGRGEALRGLSFTLNKGEILGVAGVSGNGQAELIEAITGLRHVSQGQVQILEDDLTNATPLEVIQKGVSHIPEKRRAMGVVEQMTVAENMVLKDHRTEPFSRYGMLNRKAITDHSQKLKDEFNLIAPDLWQTESRILSGGNIQRLLLGRETWREPPVIIASHPTHGLDRRAVRQTWELFISLRDQESAILLVSEDLEEVLSLSDRVAVIYNGQFMDILDGAEADYEGVGKLMAGVRA